MKTIRVELRLGYQPHNLRCGLIVAIPAATYRFLRISAQVPPCIFQMIDMVADSLSTEGAAVPRLTSGARRPVRRSFPTRRQFNVIHLSDRGWRIYDSHRWLAGRFLGPVHPHRPLPTAAQQEIVTRLQLRTLDFDKWAIAIDRTIGWGAPQSIARNQLNSFLERGRTSSLPIRLQIRFLVRFMDRLPVRLPVRSAGFKGRSRRMLLSEWLPAVWRGVRQQLDPRLWGLDNGAPQESVAPIKDRLEIVCGRQVPTLARYYGLDARLYWMSRMVSAEPGMPRNRFSTPEGY